LAFSGSKSYKRTRNLFDPQSKAPFKLSRSRLENFIKCPRCFYLDRRLGLEPPGTPPFTLNSAVDELLKKEFDSYRRKQEPHPLMTAGGVKAVPFAHPLIDEWRENFKGIQYHHLPSNFLMFGAVDDIWVDEQQRLYVVDYKATSTAEKITLESEYRQGFKRQIEIYQWLLRRQNFTVSDTGYFVFCNADKNKSAFEGRLNFNIEIVAHQGKDDWIEPKIMEARRCLDNEAIPDYSENCEYCAYLKTARTIGEPPKKDSARPKPQGELFERF